MTTCRGETDRWEPNGSCNACGSFSTTPFFGLSDLPVHVGNFFDDVESAKSTPRGSIQLAFCHPCGHVFNQAFRPDLIVYRPGYEVALHHSPVFRNFMQSVVERLYQKYRLQGKTIVEIGSGNAWFLKQLCRIGGNTGIGIDPTTSRPGSSVLDGFRLELIQDQFDRRFQSKFAEWMPDFVCCLSVLEHTADPKTLVSDLRSMLEPKKTAIYFEIFNAFRAFQRKEIWSIHYEQCSYFSEQSFRQLFTSSGFQVIEGGGCYGEDQYLYVDCIPDSLRDEPSVERIHDSEPIGHQPYPLPQEISQFAEYFKQCCQLWESRFDEYHRQGKQVVFWGTGGKGVTFLNACPSAAIIEIVAEINPAKHGKFVPGSGQKIVAPEELPKYRPDVIIISNALYEQEIRQQAETIGLRSEIHVA